MIEGRSYFDGEPADAVQELEAAGLDAHPPPRHRGALGPGDAGGYFGVKTEEEADEALAYFSRYCANCQYEEDCRGEACAIYRAEKEALSVRRGAPVVLGVPMRPGIT